MSKENDLARRERLVVSRLETSATTARSARVILGIPQNVAGLKIADLAAGASSLTPDLLASGVNVDAVDQMYQDPAVMQTMLERFLPLVIARTPNVYRARMRQITQQALDEFKTSFTADRQHYHAGWLTALPLESDTYDWVVSLNGMSDLGADVDLLTQAVNEATRIAKPHGGRIVIAPFHTSEGSHKIYAREHSQIHRSLQRKDNLEVRVEGNIPSYFDSRLVIVRK